VKREKTFKKRLSSKGALTRKNVMLEPPKAESPGKEKGWIHLTKAVVVWEGASRKKKGLERER